MRPLRLAGRLILALLGIAVLAGVWAGYQAWQVKGDLSAAASDVTLLQSSIEAGNKGATSQAISTLGEHSSSARDRTQGRTWSALAHVPWVGDDARGIRVVSKVLGELSDGNLQPLVDAAGQIDAVLPADGQVSIPALEALQDPVATSAARLTSAQQELEGEDPSGYIDILQTQYVDLSRKIGDAADGLRAASTALQVMPTMLGADGDKGYLLVVQNNAEIRATGGLPGSVSYVTARDGRIAIAKQVSGASFGEADKPVLPLTPAERQIYGPQLGTYFLDANFTPDFPRAAALMMARWQQTQPELVDGVISVDPVVLSYLLKHTGPITVGDVQLTSNNAVDELLHEVYVRYEDPRDQDAFFRKAAQAVFDRVASGATTPRGVLQALAQGVREGRVLLNSNSPTVQTVLSASRIWGALPNADTTSPQVGVYLNDATGAKMSYYLRFKAGVLATSCLGNVQRMTATTTLTSATPADLSELPDYVTGGDEFGTTPGTQTVLLRIYGPSGGHISNILLNGESIDVDPVAVASRPVVTLAIQIVPGETSDLTWRMTSGAGQTGDAIAQVTPGFEARDSLIRAPSSCQ